MTSSTAGRNATLDQFAAWVPMWLRYRVMDLRGRGVYEGVPNERQCIFIHVPKAAGSSVAQTLFGQLSRHVPYFEYERANPWKFSRYYKFAFVRNPWDRLVSTFFFLRRGGMNDADARWSAEHLRSYSDFDHFVRAWVNEPNVWTWVHFWPQHHFVCDQAFRLRVDFLGRTESLQRDFAIVAARLKCDRALAAINVGEHRHYREYYSAEARDIVAHVYRHDIRVFGYRFDDVGA